MRRRRFSWNVIIAALAMALLVAAEPAAAQTQCSPNAQDNSVGGYARMIASTTWCGGIDRVIVLARIRDVQFTCITGTTDGAYCKDSRTNGTNAQVTVGGYTCGPHEGVSQHYFYVGDDPFYVARDKLTMLNPGSCSGGGGDPAQECSAQGADYYWDGFECVYAPGSPIVIATGRGARYRMTSLDDGVLFDIDGNGTLDRVAWTDGDAEVAFLALDRDGDGAITSGKELFGNHTFPNVANGFDALLKTAMDSNGGVMRASVSSDDPVFSRLLLWTDRNHNGRSEPHELRPAAQLLSDIGLGYQVSSRRDRHGNEFRFQGWVRIRTAPGRNKATGIDEEDERRRIIFDVYFKVG